MKAEYILFRVEEIVDHNILKRINFAQVERIIFDEAHLALFWAPFRPAFSSLFKVNRTCTQKIYITATLPPSLVKNFIDVYQINEKITYIFRESTYVPNIIYEVITSLSINTDVVKIIRTLNRKMGKGMIFVKSYRECEGLFEILKQNLNIIVAIYNSWMILQIKKGKLI
jgi:superfamily II DNA helicase RecQ